MSRNALRSCVIIAASMFLTILAVQGRAGQAPRGAGEVAVAVLAKDASSGVGVVTQSGAGTAPVSVVILEERHDSRVGQLQHAVTLTRLYSRYGMRDVVLEGFLRERPPIDTRWFSQAVGSTSPEVRAKVAIRFLRNGEISAAEFLKLVYPDVVLIPSETTDTYNAELPESDATADYLTKIKRVDPAWAAQREKFYSPDVLLTLSGDQHLALAKEIKQYAEAKKIPIAPIERNAMDQFILFWQKRMASNTTIVDAVPAPTARPGEQAVAVEIGSFHTAGVYSLLKTRQRSYAVVKPLYTAKDARHPTGEKHGDLTGDMWDRKTQRVPVFNTGLSALILEETGPSKKPEPVLQTEFFQAEGEMYAYVTHLTNAVLSGGAVGGAPPKKPPYGLAADDFDGKMVRVALASVQYLPGAAGRRDSLLIPVTFKRTGHTLWVGALADRGTPGNTATSVETILMQALQQVQAESKTPRQAEDAMGRIKMDDRTLAIVGRDQAAVRRALVTAS